MGIHNGIRETFVVNTLDTENCQMKHYVFESVSEAERFMYECKSEVVLNLQTKYTLILKENNHGNN